MRFKLKEWWWSTKRKFNKEHLQFMKAAWNSHNFDSTYLLDVEQAKLKELSAYFKRSNLVEGTDIMVRDINICIGLIDIITEKYELIDYDKYFGRNIAKLPIDGKEFHNSLTNADNLRKNKDFSFLKKHVNTKNITYWCPDIDDNMLQFYQQYPDEFYKVKANKLYYKIREERTLRWWD